MKIKKFNSYDEMCIAASNDIVNLLKEKSNALLCLAGGDTPRGVYRELVKSYANTPEVFAECLFVGLDEWVGLSGDDAGSCRHFLNIELFEPLNVSKDRICFFDAISNELDKECKRIDEFVDANVGIDFALLGIGMNGHLGFNEPGTNENSDSHVIELDSSTTTVGQKYFDGGRKLKFGITQGLKRLLSAKKVCAIASGAKKAKIVQQTVCGDVTNYVPASLLQKYKNAELFVDADAGILLETENCI